MAHGGKRPGAGRPTNASTKITADLKAAAAEYTAEMLEVLVGIARAGQNDAARLGAATAVLDRGHGKPTQTVDMNLNAKPVSEWTEDDIERRLIEIAGRRRGNASPRTSTAAAGKGLPH